MEIYLGLFNPNLRQPRKQMRSMGFEPTQGDSLPAPQAGASAIPP